jgi:hypothetical protein
MGFDKDYAEIPLTWERGMVETVESSMLPIGAAPRLRNWEPDPSGNLRSRVGWLKASTTGGIPSTRKGWGIGQLALPRRPYVVQDTSGSSTSGTTPAAPAATWGSATTAGNLLVAVLTLETEVIQTAANMATPPTPPAGGWTLAKSMISNAVVNEHSHVWIYYIENASSQSGAKTWSIPFSGGGNAAADVMMFEVANCKTSGALGRVGKTYDVANAGAETTVIISPKGDIGGTVADTGTEIISTRDTHGFSVGNSVRFTKYATGALPTGVSEDTTYWVLTVDSSTSFTITDTVDGTSAVNITGAGTQDTWGVGKWPRTTPVGIAFIGIAHGDNIDVSMTTEPDDVTKEREHYTDNGTVDANSFVYSSVYQTVSEHDDFTFVLSSAGYPSAAIAEFIGLDYDVTDGYYFVAHNGTTTLDIWYHDRDDLSTGNWTLLEQVTATPGNLPVAYTAGNEKLFYVHPGFETVRSWGGLGTTPVAIEGSNPGRCVAWHKNRLFTGGAPGSEWVLYYSEVGDDTIWDSGTASHIEVGKGDGEAIEDITPFQDGLLIGKQTSLWLLTGSGPDNFRLIRLPIGGAAPGRTVLATPYGAVVAGRKDVWLVNGGSVEHISGPIRESYGITGDWMSVSYIDDHAYVLDQGSGTAWVIDFSNGGTWREERVDSASTEAPACLYNQDDKQLFAPKNATIGSLLSYRLLPGSPRGKDFDTLTETWVAWTPEIWPVGPQEKITPRYLYLKLRQRAGDAGDNVLSVTPLYNGTAITALTVTPVASASVYWVRLDIGSNASGKSVSSVQFKIDQTLDSTETAVFDIEEMTLGFNIESVV